MQHRPAEVRVSNYNTGVLRIAQRDAKANGVFVQPTGPQREEVLLGTLCAMTEAVQKNLGGLSGSRVVHSMFLPCEDGLMHFGGVEEKHLPTSSTFTAALKVMLPCGKGLSRNSFAGSSQAGLVAFLCSPRTAQPRAAGKGLVLDAKGSLSARTPAAGCSLGAPS